MVVSRGNAEKVSRQGARFFLYDVRCGLFLSAQRLINQLYLCVLELVFYINQAHSTKTFTLGLGEKYFENYMMCLFHAEGRSCFFGERGIITAIPPLRA